MPPEASSHRGHSAGYVEPSLTEVVGFSDLCYSGEEGYPTAVIYDSRQFTREQAENGARDALGSSTVECTISYARWLERAEQWEYDMDTEWERHLDDVWDEDVQGEPPDAPDDPPEWYEPDETSPVWTTCKPTDKGAVLVYRCSVPRSQKNEPEAGR